jgi:hypothetical protein
VGERSCQPSAEQRRPQRAGRQRCRQLGQGLLHLAGRQILELDHAELADRMIGKTPVIPDGAGLPRRESVVEPVPDAGRHRAGSGDTKPGLEFAVECLELLPDFGLGPTSGLLPDPAAGG